MKWESATLISLVSLTLTVVIKTETSSECDPNNSFKFEYGDSYDADEGVLRDFKCSIDMNLPDDCKDLLKSDNRLAAAQLVINGVVQSNVSEVKSKIDGDYKIFNITLNYESHHEATLSCMTITPEVNYTSNSETINKVNEMHYLTLSTSEMKIVAGQNYLLNCTAENKRGLEMIAWYIAVNDQRSNILFCDKQPVVPCKIETVEDPHSSLITVETSKDLEKSQTYTYYCTTELASYHKNQNRSLTVDIVVIPVDNSWVVIVSSVIAVAVVIGSVVVVVLFVRRRRLRSAVKLSMQMADVRENVQPYNSYDVDPLENDALLSTAESVNAIMDRISSRHSCWIRGRQSLIIKEQIGVGNFGAVFSGTMPNDQGIIQNVAIKTIKEQSLDVGALLDFEKEIDMMTSIHHDNIVNLLGICTTSLPFYIITELMENGQLNTYLTNFAPSQQHPLGGISVPVLARMCHQPCDALDYLTSKNLVHRDVSARNCLVGANDLVKLADFGLSRDTSDNAKNYYKKAGGMVPVKWMAPEALTYGKYTSSNDVWAFGILCWEVFSFGAQPYAHLNNQEVMVRICKGERLERPQFCPESLWDVIIKCWSDAPDDRITFSALLTFFMDYSKELTD